MPFFAPGGGYFELSATQRVIGEDAGDGNTGDDVILGGAGAGDNNTGDAVLALGIAAAADATVNNLIALGSGAFAGGVTDADMAGGIAIGVNALNAMILGERNIGIGFEAGLDWGNAFCRDNVAIGFQAAAGIGNTTPQRSVVIGALAGSAYTGALSNCIYIGPQAGRGVAGTGVRNVGIGSGGLLQAPLIDVTTGGNNICIGFEAGREINSGNNNVAIGSGAGDSITSGDDNVLIGIAAGNSISTSDGNTFIGETCVITVPGSQNTCIGGDIAESIAMGDRNVIIGNRAARGGVVAGYDDTFIVENFVAPLAQPFLFGEIDNGNLTLGNLLTGVAPDTGPRTFSGNCVFSLADSFLSAGGIPVANPTRSVYIYFDGNIGVNVGELRARFSNGTVVSFAAS